MNNISSVFISAVKDFQYVMGNDIDKDIEKHDSLTQLAIKTTMLDVFQNISNVYNNVGGEDATRFIRACKAISRSSITTANETSNPKDYYESLTLNHLPQFVLHHDLMQSSFVIPSRK